MGRVDELLLELAKGKIARSETAKLREVFSSVELAIQAGVSRAAILDTLHSQGFSMTFKGFENALYRIRKERTKQRLSSNMAKIGGTESLKPATGAINSISDDNLQQTSDKKDKGLNRKKENPFHSLNKIASGDLRRDEFNYNPVPDKTKIYGKKD